MANIISEQSLSSQDLETFLEQNDKLLLDHIELVNQLREKKQSLFDAEDLIIELLSHTTDRNEISAYIVNLKQHEDAVRCIRRHIASVLQRIVDIYRVTADQPVTCPLTTNPNYLAPHIVPCITFDKVIERVDGCLKSYPHEKFEDNHTHILFTRFSVELSPRTLSDGVHIPGSFHYVNVPHWKHELARKPYLFGNKWSLPAEERPLNAFELDIQYDKPISSLFWHQHSPVPKDSYVEIEALSDGDDDAHLGIETEDCDSEHSSDSDLNTILSLGANAHDLCENCLQNTICVCEDADFPCSKCHKYLCSCDPPTISFRPGGEPHCFTCRKYVCTCSSVDQFGLCTVCHNKECICKDSDSDIELSIQVIATPKRNKSSESTCPTQEETHSKAKRPRSRLTLPPAPKPTAQRLLAINPPPANI